MISLNPARQGDRHDKREQARTQRGVRGRDEIEQEGQRAQQQTRESKKDAQRGIS